MMQFRNHPLMHHWGFPNWPPVWVATRGLTQRVEGEVGILKAVKKVDFIKNKFFLTIEYNHQTYTGCLAFTDQSFCHFAFDLLLNHLEESIVSIGDLDVSYTL